MSTAVRPHPSPASRQPAEPLRSLYLDESQLYRIDHFPGKIGLADILFLRFANVMAGHGRRHAPWVAS